MAKFVYFESTDEYFKNLIMYEVRSCSAVGKDSLDNNIYETLIGYCCMLVNKVVKYD